MIYHRICESRGRIKKGIFIRAGKGYATELLKTMTDFVANTFDINILYGRVMRGNNASVRVLEKSGYEFVREEFGAEDDPYGNGMLIYKRVMM